jgi:hypothetical protein
MTQVKEAPGKNGKVSAAKTDTLPAVIDLDRIAAETLKIPIIGTTPLVVHRFSEKEKKKMLDLFQNHPHPKEPKDPEAEYEGAFYRFEDGGSGFPVIGFKACTIGGARFYHGLTMTLLRQCMFFQGEVGVDGQALARIEGEPRMREDVVRVSKGGTDLRYRPEFREWRTELTVVYVTSMLTRGSLLSLIDAGGMGVGVGEWRPEKKGTSGTFKIDPDRTVEVIS